MKTPYSKQPASAFWRTGVVSASWGQMPNLYPKKFPVTPDCRIATAGSCFAQHIARYLKKNGYNLLDVEPPPSGLRTERLAHYGYGIFSARFGNIYTARHLLLLAQEAFARREQSVQIWMRDNRFFDAMRPRVEPNGLDSREEVLAHRRKHIEKVQLMFLDMDIFIFTLGLTEAWEDIATGEVFPVCPGVIAGEYDPDCHRFRNFRYDEILADFEQLIQLIAEARITAGRSEANYILTVSPVPLIATASTAHVLPATVLSKSILRAVAGTLAETHDNIDYFPSFEIIASPWSNTSFYAENLRDVTAEGVETVMRYFFQAHGIFGGANTVDAAHEEEEDEVWCDEAILEAINL